MNPLFLIPLIGLLTVGVVSSASAYDIIVSRDYDVTIDRSVDVKFRTNDVDGTGITTTSVNGENTLISSETLSGLTPRDSSPAPSLAPHMTGFGRNIAYDSAFTFEGADVTYVGNGGGTIKVRGWATQDSFDVYCHGEFLDTIYLGKGHNGSFEVYIPIPLDHQLHSEEIIDEKVENGWYIKTTRTWVGQ